MTNKQRTLFQDVYTPGSFAKYAVIKDDEYIGWIRVVPTIDHEGNEIATIIYGDWTEALS